MVPVEPGHPVLILPLNEFWAGQGEAGSKCRVAAMLVSGDPRHLASHCQRSEAILSVVPDGHEIASFRPR